VVRRRKHNDVGTHLWRGTAASVVHWSEAAGAGAIGGAQHRRHTQLHSLLPCGSVARSFAQFAAAAECSSLMHCYPHPYITHTLFHSQFCHANNLLALINIHWFANNIPLRPAAALLLLG